MVVYSNSTQHDRIEQTIAHFGPVSHILVSPSNRQLFTAGADGSLFIFDIHEQVFNYKEKTLKASIQIDEGDKKGNMKIKDQRYKIVDPELADIVLVKRNEMVEWQQRQKQLKYDLALTKKKVEMKLKECKRRFTRQREEIERQKNLDIKDLEKRYGDLQEQKKIQDKQNREAMQMMESNHYTEVEDIEKIYEKKLYAQASEYLTLE